MGTTRVPDTSLCRFDCRDTLCMGFRTGTGAHACAWRRVAAGGERVGRVRPESLCCAAAAQHAGLSTSGKNDEPAKCAREAVALRADDMSPDSCTVHAAT